jgi:hypothetical protein
MSYYLFNPCDALSCFSINIGILIFWAWGGFKITTFKFLLSTCVTKQWECVTGWVKKMVVTISCLYFILCGCIHSLYNLDHPIIIDSYFILNIHFPHVSYGCFLSSLFKNKKTINGTCHGPIFQKLASLKIA